MIKRLIFRAILTEIASVSWSSLEIKPNKAIVTLHGMSNFILNSNYLVHSQNMILETKIRAIFSAR